MLELLSVLFFALAAISNSLMDTLQFHWGTFRWNNNVNPQWWNPILSWRNKYIGGEPKNGLRFKGMWGWISNFLDAWHTFKMIQIFLLAFSVLCFDYHNNYFFDYYLWNEFTWLVIFGVAWNAPFNLFFNKIFVVKNK